MLKKTFRIGSFNATSMTHSDPCEKEAFKSLLLKNLSLKIGTNMRN